MTVEAQKGIDTVLFASQTVTDGATITANIDTAGADWCSIRVNIGAEETGSATATVLSLLESDDTVVTNFATITADLAPDAETAHLVRYEVDCRGARQRYLRLSWTSGTETGSNQLISALATLSRNPVAPATLAASNSSTNDTVVLP